MLRQVELLGQGAVDLTSKPRQRKMGEPVGVTATGRYTLEPESIEPIGTTSTQGQLDISKMRRSY